MSRRALVGLTAGPLGRGGGRLPLLRREAHQLASMRHVVLNEPIETLIEREPLAQGADFLLQGVDGGRRIGRSGFVGLHRRVSGDGGKVTAAGLRFRPGV